MLASIALVMIVGRNCFAHPTLGLMRMWMMPIGDGGAIDDIVARVVIVGIVVRVAFRWGEAGAGIDKPGRSMGVARLIDLVAIQGAPASPLPPSRSSRSSWAWHGRSTARVTRWRVGVE